MEIPAQMKERIRTFFLGSFKSTIQHDGFTVTIASLDGEDAEYAHFTVKKGRKTVFSDDIEDIELISYAEDMWNPDYGKSVLEILDDIMKDRVDWARKEHCF